MLTSNVFLTWQKFIVFEPPFKYSMHSVTTIFVAFLFIYKETSSFALFPSSKLLEMKENSKDYVRIDTTV